MISIYDKTGKYLLLDEIKVDRIKERCGGYAEIIISYEDYKKYQNGYLSIYNIISCKNIKDKAFLITKIESIPRLIKDEKQMILIGTIELIDLKL